MRSSFIDVVHNQCLGSGIFDDPPASRKPSVAVSSIELFYLPLSALRADSSGGLLTRLFDFSGIP
jgi:hypothetical protein